MLKAFNGVVALVAELFGQAMAVIFEADFWDAMINGFTAAVNTMAKTFLEIMTPVVEKLSSGFTDIALAIANPIREGMGKDKLTKKDAQFILFGGPDALKEAKNELGKTASDYSAKTSASIDKLKKSGVLSLDEGLKKFNEGLAGTTMASDAAQKAIDELSNKAGGLLKRGRENRLKGQAGEEAAPGTGPEALAMKTGTINTKFDELRRVGGGAGGMALGTAEKSLSALHQIRDLIKEQGKKRSENWTGARLSQQGLTFTGPATS